MKRINYLVLAVIVGVGIILPGTFTTQGNDWTCDGGPDDILIAAEAAKNTANDLEGDERKEKLLEAYWLAAQGEVLCAMDNERFGEVQSLRRGLESRLRTAPGGPLGLEPGVVELGDFGLSMICVGEGSPTVIFENGLGGGAGSTWENIQPAVSTVTRTCRYDRRNIGASARSARLDSDAVRTTQDQIDDLILLLETAAIEPPYVLVAHSRGGVNVLLFANQQPTLVQGLVLVDASHPAVVPRTCQVAPENCLLNWLPTDSYNEEHLDFVTSQEQVGDIESIGDRPLAVLTAAKQAHFWSDEEYEVWYELQGILPMFSTNSRHIMMENTDHVIQNGGDLNLVIDAIVWVVGEVRAVQE